MVFLALLEVQLSHPWLDLSLLLGFTTCWLTFTRSPCLCIHVKLSQFPRAASLWNLSLSCSPSALFYFAFTPIPIVNTSVITGVNCRYAILLITANWLVSDFALDCMNSPGSEQLVFVFMNHVCVIPEELKVVQCMLFFNHYCGSLCYEQSYALTSILLCWQGTGLLFFPFLYVTF